jgi:hypothetical protein
VTQNEEVRFMAKVVADTSGCWQWTGAKNSWGYGNVRIAGRTERAHRSSYQIFIGPIPAGLTLDHLCRNRACVNPLHLEAVTMSVNIRRGQGICVVNSRKTYCAKGHPYSEANTYLTTRGGRECRICRREWYTRDNQKRRHPERIAV